MPISSDLLTRLIVREHDKLASYTWLIVYDDHVVEEVLQEMAVVATRRMGDIVDELHFPAWARSTCRNLAMEMLRKRRRRPLVLSNEVLELLEVEWRRFDGADSAGLTAALRECVKLLSRRAREIVHLRYVSGLTSAHVAEQLGTKVTTIYVALSRIHNTLRECIRKKQTQEAANE